jgi:hypothetical protein
MKEPIEEKRGLIRPRKSFDERLIYWQARFRLDLHFVTDHAL